ncbi:transposase [Nitrosomonas sp.]|uniref:transposase n=1 Tax=Nitrosomonas sp. TaxID=42353 RepID=UPI003454F665
MCKTLNAESKIGRNSKKITEIPGVGMMTATALAVIKSKANYFKCEQELDAFVGLAPSQSDAGSRVDY